MPDSSSHEAIITRPPLLRLLVLFTLGTVAVALWFLASHLLRDAGQVHWYPEAPGCELSAGPCLAELGNERRLALDLGVRGEIRALQRLPLEVALDGVDAQRVVVDFVGRDMDMGLHRFPLQDAGDGLFHGEGQVAICTEAVMSWRAKVVVDTPRGRLGSWFDFTVVRRPS